ncbi:MAG: Integrase [Paucimonas sp.]|nr:Integrase [Paucimonas sp.]
MDASPIARRRCVSIVNLEILPVFAYRQLNEITADKLRVLRNEVKARVRPPLQHTFAVIVKQVYAFAPGTT